MLLTPQHYIALHCFVFSLAYLYSDELTQFPPKAGYKFHPQVVPRVALTSEMGCKSGLRTQQQHLTYELPQIRLRSL